MIEPVLRDGDLIGYKMDGAHALFFFGTKKLSRESFGPLFPEFEFCFLKQVHGTDVVPADPSRIVNADGHFTAKTNQALMIQTADCIPLMLASRSQVCALHSGWRGAAGNIVAVAKRFFDQAPKVAVIGPHIQRSSFEIGRDVMAQLTNAAPAGANVEKLVLKHRDSNKCYFDLGELLRIQLISLFPEIQIFAVDEDTFTSPKFHSFRRDQGGGRQYSFVVLKR